MNQLLVKTRLLLCALLLVSLSVQSQDDVKLLAKPHIEQNTAKYNLTADDIKEWSISNHHVSKQSGIHHIYGNQQLNGIDIYQATFSLHLQDNQTVVAYHNNFITNLNNASANVTNKANLTAVDALQSAARNLNLELTHPIIISEDISAHQKKLEAPSISRSPIPSKLIYFQNDDKKLVLVWDLIIDDFKNNMWNIKIDAQSGNLVDQLNMVLACSTGDHDHSNHTNYGPHQKKEGNIKNMLFTGETYNVFAYPLESPHYGNPSLVTNPYDAVASPNGWHDYYGSTAYRTQGNNVFAYEDDPFNDEPGAFPSSFNLTFDYDYNLNFVEGDYNAAVTNLFYWTNLCHDVWYHHGFDESSGNFQESNYGNGGTGFDSVKAEAHNLSTPCNAFFSFVPEGTKPQMRLHICEGRDSALDNLVIAHEYGHGISTRLVGGASNVFTLLNVEQMGEGWSDWFGLMMTMTSNDSPETPRTVGTWFENQNIDGPGIRHWPYSTDMTISPYTYESTETLYNIYGYTPHEIGSVWAAMLWELTWGFIDEYGFDANLHTGTGGNNKVMTLIIESLKLTPSNPGFVEARDAILQADTVLNNGINHCIIWDAFAKRGLGVNAQQNNTVLNPLALLDNVNSFDVPECLNVCYGTSVEIVNSDRFPECSEIDFNGHWMNFDVDVSLTPPENYDLEDFIEDSNAGNITLDIIDHDDPNNTVIATYLHLANNPPAMGPDGTIQFSFPILNETFWGINTEGNYDFEVHVNLTTDSDAICSKSHRVIGISFDNCPEIDCNSNSISLFNNIPDAVDLEPPYDFNVCGMFIVHGGQVPVEINLEISDVANPANTFTVTIENPAITGPVPNANAGEFGNFCFDMNLSDFPTMEGNYEMTAYLVTEMRSETCTVGSQTTGFSFVGFGQGQTNCDLIKEIDIKEGHLLTWDGSAEHYTLQIQPDKYCCKSDKPSEEDIISIALTGHSFDLNEIQNQIGPCIKYKITSNCGDDTPWCCAVRTKKEWLLPKGNCLVSTRVSHHAITVSPNPATNVLDISSKTLDLSSVEIYTIYGNKTQTFDKLSTREFRINVNRLARGYYVIKIILEDGTFQYKNVILK